MLFSAIHAAMRQDTFALEAIDFQLDKKFGLELERELEYLNTQRMSKDALRRSRIGKIIEDFTGMPTTIIGHEEDELYMNYTDAVHKNHAFLTWQREWLENPQHAEKIIKDGSLPITVDLAKGRVLGIPKEWEHIIGIGAGLFKIKGMTIPMIVAGILHEVGHWLAYYVWLSRTTSTNFLLTDFVSRILGTHDPIKKMEIIDEYRRAGVKNDVFAVAVEAKRPEELQVVIISSEVKEARSALGIDIYDSRAWEQMADQYATRWGYGKEVVMLLETLYANYGMNGWKWPAFSILADLAIIASFAMLAAGTVVLFAAGNPLAIYSGFGAAVLLMGVFFGDHQTEVYDSIKVRYQAVRKQLIAKLKVIDNKDLVRNTIEDIQAIDAVIDRVYDHVGIFKFLHNRLGFINGRRNFRHTTTQKLLEDFANSDLNILVAKLEHED
jgi:hypothetical protein